LTIFIISIFHFNQTIYIKNYFNIENIIPNSTKRGSGFIPTINDYVYAISGDVFKFTKKSVSDICMSMVPVNIELYNWVVPENEIFVKIEGGYEDRIFMIGVWCLERNEDRYHNEEPYSWCYRNFLYFLTNITNCSFKNSFTRIAFIFSIIYYNKFAQ
jgi:hypothetical protein